MITGTMLSMGGGRALAKGRSRQSRSPSRIEAVRVHALPTPGIAAHGAEIALGAPAEQGSRARRVGIARGDVAGTTGHDLVRHLAAARCLEGAHHFEDAVPATRAEIEGERRFALEQVV